MILKNTDFHKVKNVTALEFGAGDIAVTSMENKQDKYTGVVFQNIKSGKINRDCPEIKTGLINKDHAFEVVMIFSKVESIDVVLDALKDAKRALKRCLKRKNTKY